MRSDISILFCSFVGCRRFKFVLSKFFRFSFPISFLQLFTQPAQSILFSRFFHMNLAFNYLKSNHTLTPHNRKKKSYLKSRFDCALMFIVHLTNVFFFLFSFQVVRLTHSISTLKLKKMNRYACFYHFNEWEWKWNGGFVLENCASTRRWFPFKPKSESDKSKYINRLSMLLIWLSFLLRAEIWGLKVEQIRHN